MCILCTAYESLTQPIQYKLSIFECGICKCSNNKIYQLPIKSWKSLNSVNTAACDCKKSQIAKPLQVEKISLWAGFKRENKKNTHICLHKLSAQFYCLNRFETHEAVCSNTFESRFFVLFCFVHFRHKSYSSRVKKKKQVFFLTFHIDK